MHSLLSSESEHVVLWAKGKKIYIFYITNAEENRKCICPCNKRYNVIDLENVREIRKYM